MAEGKRLLLVKPTINTPFHIDFQWWRQNDRNWRVYLQSYITNEEDLKSLDLTDDQLIDIIDPNTAEVQQVDALQHLLITKYAQNEDFITETTSTSESIFRLLLANGNAPLTVVELAGRLHKDSTTVLRMLSGPRVYKGIRPTPQN